VGLQGEDGSEKMDEICSCKGIAKELNLWLPLMVNDDYVFDWKQDKASVTAFVECVIECVTNAGPAT